MAVSDESAFSLYPEGRLLAMGTHHKLRPLAFAPRFDFIAIGKTEQTMTAYAVTAVGSTPPLLSLRRKLHVLALMFDSVVAQRHPATLELRRAHAMAIVGDDKR